MVPYMPYKNLLYDLAMFAKISIYDPYMVSKDMVCTFVRFFNTHKIFYSSHNFLGPKANCYHIWFLYGSYVVHTWLLYDSKMLLSRAVSGTSFIQQFYMVQKSLLRGSLMTLLLVIGSRMALVWFLYDSLILFNGIQK